MCYFLISLITFAHHRISSSIDRLVCSVSQRCGSDQLRCGQNATYEDLPSRPPMPMPLLPLPLPPPLFSPRAIFHSNTTIIMKFAIAALLATSAAAFAPVSQGPARASTSLNVWGDKDYLIAPSILSADFAKLGEEVDNVLEAGADVVHFDVMDNHYVPNLTIGPMVCKALRDHGVTAPIDVHLMVSPVDAAISDFIDAGASYITFHPEATNHVDRSLQLIKNGGCKAGLVFNPATSLDVAQFVLDKLDIILLMSVNPGFGGQAFIPGTLDKAREARKIIDDAGIDCRLEIDGGVKVDNIKEVCEAGVDMFVAGSAILKEPRTVEAYKETIDEMRKELAAAKK